MRHLKNVTWALLLAGAGFALAGCQNSEERAEEHYERAQELLAAGDFDRARLEFMNVFQNDGLHREARSDFALMLRDQGEVQQSYSQYLRLVEQYPDDVEGRLALAEMAIQFQSWEEAERHGSRAMELAPDDPRSEVISISLGYATAVEDGDEPARRASVDTAQALLADDPANPLLLRLSVDDALRAGDLQGALAAVDEVLAQEPGNLIFHQTKLSILAELEDSEGVVGQLRAMMAEFP